MFLSPARTPEINPDPAGNTKTARRWVPSACSLLLLVTGCTSQIPTLIREPVEPLISVEQARRSSADLEGRPVRWGGEIIEVENKRNETLVETLSYPLSGSGRPDREAASQSRFIARIPGFIDPAEYKAGRALTVYGKIGEKTTRKLGDYPYTYPVVNTSVFYLWPDEPERVDVYYPWYPWPHYPRAYYWWYYPYRPHHPLRR